MIKYYIEKIIVTPHATDSSLYTIYLNDDIYCHCSKDYLPGCIKSIIENSQK